MPISATRGGAYSQIVGMSFKRSGVYQAVAGAYIKIGGVYQQILSSDPVAPTNIILSASAIGESAAVGTVVGKLSANGYPAATYSKILDADSKFSVVGNELRIAAALDYATATSHSVTIRAINSAGSYDKVFAISVTQAELPVATESPYINGTPRVGNTLAVNKGIWSNAVSYAVQWKRNGASISGATSDNYALIAADLGATITVTVTATGPGGSASATAAGVGPIADILSVIPDLYSSGQVGAWYQVSDLTTLFQDAGATVPVTATGQAVRVVKDKSGRGNDLALSAGIALQKDADNAYYLTRSGAGNGATAAITWPSDKISLFAVIDHASSGSNAAIIASGNISTETGTFGLYGSSAKNTVYTHGSGAFGARTSSAAAVRVKQVVSVQWDLTGTTQETEIPVMRKNGLPESTTVAGAADSGSGNFAAYPLKVFAGSYGVDYIGKIYEIVLVEGLVSAVDPIESELAARSVVTLDNLALGYSLTPADWTDSYAPVSRAGYLETSAYSYVELTTTSTKLDVTAYTSAAAIFPAWATIGVYVNGTWNQTVTYTTNNTAAKKRIFLPAGAKTVRLVNGLQTRPVPSNPVLGTWVTQIDGDAALTQSMPSPVSRDVFLVDSIGVGGNSTDPHYQAWTMLVRAARGSNSTVVEGYGYRSIWDDCQDSTKRAALVARIAALAPSRLWIQVGTNDYGLNRWTAAAFGTAYGQLLTDLHAALPSLAIYCQTPIVRVNEGANGSGSTLPDYRSQIATAAAARSSYCTFVDGTAILALSDLQDAVHPSTAGHAKYATAVRTVLGI